MQLVLKSFRNNWHIYIRIQNWLNTSSLHVMLFQILWRLFTAQLFKSHNFFMPAFMLHKCTHALNYLLLKFVYKKTLFTYNNGLKIGVSLFSFNFVFMWYFFNLHSKHLFINTPVLYTVSLLSPFLYYIQDKNVSGSLFKFIIIFLRRKTNSTSSYATFSKKNWILFWPQKVEKTPSKVAQKTSNPLFFLTALSCPNRRIHVPKCGL